MASSSSSISLPVLSSQSWKYDVFLSFRGEDTRKNFVDHLYSALHQSGIHTYKDNVTLPRGESISPALLKTIEESQIAVIVFSKNYANSSWCLDELTHIMKCRDDRKQIVMPLFYDVEPTEVRKQTGKYKEAFNKHELTNKENTESWRKALVEASNISGWEIKQIANGHEAEGIKQIVGEISQRLNHVNSGVNKDLIGIMTRVQGLKSQLQIESGGVRMVAIWGVGGGGKTTLASSIYYEICSAYDGCCFLENIREESSKNGLKNLQEKIISGALKQNEVQKVSGVEEGRRMIKARLRHKKVLIVLDDVDEVDQLEALVGSRDWFGEGSRIIITTRDEHILVAHGVDIIQRISLLNDSEAVRLFRKHAHRDRKPTEDIEKLSEEVVYYAHGLPLALKVLGSFLCGRSSMQWKSALQKLKDIPHKDIIGKLRISFDGLEQDEKDLFLDIACFFRWKDARNAMMLLGACGLHPVIGVEVLREKALIVIGEDGKFDMHDVLQEMAHYIVRGNHPKNPEKHSRVWKEEEVRRILDMAATKELDNIEAINLEDISYEESQRFLQVIGNMTKLRWIDLSLYGEKQRDHRIVPLPASFPPTQLCYLRAEYCIPQKQLWKGYKHLPNLTYMKLLHLPNLIKIPDFSGLPNLQTFELSKCPCLEEIDPSIGQLENLVFLSVKNCPDLTMFPSITRIKKLETFKFSKCVRIVKSSQFQEIQLHEIDNLAHPQLDHSGNSLPGVDYFLSDYNWFLRRLQLSHSTLRKLNLMKLPSRDEEATIDFGELPNLEELDLSKNLLISPLDFSNRLPRLKYLNVSGCFTISHMQVFEPCILIIRLPSSIAVVDADDCVSLKSFEDVSNCKWLWKVSIKEKHKLDQCDVDTLIDSMLQGNASKDHFMSVAIGTHQFRDTYIESYTSRNICRQHLPDNWYEDSCGFLIFIATDGMYPKITITMKLEDHPFDHSEEEESDEAKKRIDGRVEKGCVGYVPFSSLTQTALLSTSYNTISVTTEHPLGISAEILIKLIPRKSKSDEVQKPDYSGYWGKKHKTFKIQQCDAESSINISWKP